MNLVYSGLSAQNVADLVLGFSGMTSVIFLIVSVLFGAYGIYGVCRLKKEQYLIPHRIMYPSYCNYEDCLDPEEYMRFIIPRLAIVSAVMLLAGVLLFLSYFIPAIRTIKFLLALYIVPLVVYLWYSICLRRARKKYW